MLGFVLLMFHLDLFKLSRSVLFIIVIISFLTKPEVLIDIPNCPNCFGNELCDSIENGEIRLDWFSRFLVILHPRLTKSVFFGKLNNSRDVVLKSMTRRGQLRPKHYHSMERDSIIRDNVLAGDDVIRNVVLCPNVRSIDALFESVDKDMKNLINMNLWFDIQISIEPILLKFLSLMEGMPVPSYCGACGDVIAKEFKGKALNNYYNCDWRTRAFLSIQLLKMAEAFTFNHESFIFYFTDISSDNIAVDASGMVYLTDLDHVIIAERQLNYSSDLPGREIVHVSSVVDPIKLAISPSDICKHPVSDHNYFAVCRNILLYSEEMGRGLLPGIPSDIEEKEWNLEKLLEECAHPKKYENRITPGRLLREALNRMVSNVGWKDDS